MIKKIKMICFGLLFTQILHAGSISLIAGANMDFVLNPHDRQEFTNISFQAINATCAITTDAVSGNDIFVEVLRKKGKVNDIPLSAGDNVIIHVNNHDNLFIVAESGGKVALTNLSDFKVIAKCVS